MELYDSKVKRLKAKGDLQVETLKDEVEDQCRHSQLDLLDGVTTTAGISLPHRTSKPFRREISQFCTNTTFFSKVVHLGTVWQGYYSKEESKTPNIGVPPRKSGGRTPPA